MYKTMCHQINLIGRKAHGNPLSHILSCIAEFRNDRDISDFELADSICIQLHTVLESNDFVISHIPKREITGSGHPWNIQFTSSKPGKRR